MKFNMTPAATIIGSLVVFFTIVVMIVIFPAIEYRLRVQPSDIFRPRTAQMNRGRAIYIENGCQYCHSQYVRPQDGDYGQDRVAQAGDYFEDQPPLLGSERQGPDLSREGGLRSDGWHWAHFTNPRHTRPDSIMPPFHWLSVPDMEDLTAYVQGLGGTDADARVAQQHRWRDAAWEAYEAGPTANTEWLHAHVPSEWMEMANPYVADARSMDRGHFVYQHFCIGCHGPVGDGRGPGGLDILRRNEMLIAEPASGEYDFAPEAPPYNFTYLSSWDGPIGGMIYYQVMNGITGTSMPAFKTELESDMIWAVANYLAVNFVGRYGAGQSESEVFRGQLPRTIPPSSEPHLFTQTAPLPLPEVLAGASSAERRRAGPAGVPAPGGGDGR